MSNIDLSQPQLDGIQYCIRCCIPSTQELVKFDEMGICQACQSSEQKIHINWVEKENELKRILKEAKDKSGNNYDCIVPISGGKDSTFQLHVLTKVYGMKALAVTFSHNWYSETGWYNLQNSLEKFNVDHIMFTPNRDLVNRIARHSLEAIGDTCWHCHAGVGAFPLQVAVKFNIPLLIYGESIAESSGRSSYKNPLMDFNVDYFMKVSTKRNPKDMVCEYITEKDMKPFFFPTIEELEKAGVRLMHLGDYIFWDDERQMEFVRDTYAWKETEVEGTYKGYKSAECIMPGMHDFTNYLKRGYGRSTYQASVDVRNGLLSREEGFQLANQYDREIPESLKYYLKITGMSE
ncbi:MAG: N-acetyl sugar amidotransferase, partial [Ignavibacteria bacterium]